MFNRKKLNRERLELYLMHLLLATRRLCQDQPSCHQAIHFFLGQ